MQLPRYMMRRKGASVSSSYSSPPRDTPRWQDKDGEDNSECCWGNGGRTAAISNGSRRLRRLFLAVSVFYFCLSMAVLVFESNFSSLTLFSSSSSFASSSPIIFAEAQSAAPNTTTTTVPATTTRAASKDDATQPLYWWVILLAALIGFPILLLSCYFLLMWQQKALHDYKGKYEEMLKVLGENTRRVQEQIAAAKKKRQMEAAGLSTDHLDGKKSKWRGGGDSDSDDDDDNNNNNTNSKAGGGGGGNSGTNDTAAVEMKPLILNRAHYDEIERHKSNPIHNYNIEEDGENGGGGGGADEAAEELAKTLAEERMAIREGLLRHGRSAVMHAVSRGGPMMPVNIPESWREPLDRSGAADASTNKNNPQHSLGGGRVSRSYVTSSSPLFVSPSAANMFAASGAGGGGGGLLASSSSGNYYSSSRPTTPPPPPLSTFSKASAMVLAQARSSGNTPAKNGGGGGGALNTSLQDQYTALYENNTNTNNNDSPTHHQNRQRGGVGGSSSSATAAATATASDPLSLESIAADAAAAHRALRDLKKTGPLRHLDSLI